MIIFARGVPLLATNIGSYLSTRVANMERLAGHIEIIFVRWDSWISSRGAEIARQNSLAGQPLDHRSLRAATSEGDSLALA